MIWDLRGRQAIISNVRTLFTDGGLQAIWGEDGGLNWAAISEMRCFQLREILEISRPRRFRFSGTQAHRPVSHGEGHFPKGFRNFAKNFLAPFVGGVGK